MTPEPSYEQMVAEIFSAPERMLQLEAGEVLLEQGQPNMRLFCGAQWTARRLRPR